MLVRFMQITVERLSEAVAQTTLLRQQRNLLGTFEFRKAFYHFCGDKVMGVRKAEVNRQRAEEAVSSETLNKKYLGARVPNRRSRLACQESTKVKKKLV